MTQQQTKCHGTVCPVQQVHIVKRMARTVKLLLVLGGGGFHGGSTTLRLSNVWKRRLAWVLWTTTISPLLKDVHPITTRRCARRVRGGRTKKRRRSDVWNVLTIKVIQCGSCFWSYLARWRSLLE